MTDGKYTGPPIVPGDYQLEGFRWCQVEYLYARELHKQGVDVEAAYLEAVAAREAMEPWGSPTPPLADRREPSLVVHWPTLICSANAYASAPPLSRQQMREAMARGVPASVVPTGYTGGCERKVLDDPEYDPAPPCVPQQVASTGIAAALAFGLTASLAWLLLRTRKPSPRRS